MNETTCLTTVKIQQRSYMCNVDIILSLENKHSNSIIRKQNTLQLSLKNWLYNLSLFATNFSMSQFSYNLMTVTHTALYSILFLVKPLKLQLTNNYLLISKYTLL